MSQRTISKGISAVFLTYRTDNQLKWFTSKFAKIVEKVINISSLKCYFFSSKIGNCSIKLVSRLLVRKTRKYSYRKGPKRKNPERIFVPGSFKSMVLVKESPLLSRRNTSPRLFCHYTESQSMDIDLQPLYFRPEQSHPILCFCLQFHR